MNLSQWFQEVSALVYIFQKFGVVEGNATDYIKKIIFNGENAASKIEDAEKRMAAFKEIIEKDLKSKFATAKDESKRTKKFDVFVEKMIKIKREDEFDFDDLLSPEEINLMTLRESIMSLNKELPKVEVKVEEKKVVAVAKKKVVEKVEAPKKAKKQILRETRRLFTPTKNKTIMKKHLNPKKSGLDKAISTRINTVNNKVISYKK